MDYSNYFDKPASIAYLNTPGNGLMPRSHYDWRRTREAAFFDPEGMLRDQQTVFIKEVKDHFSRLFGVSSLRTYLVPNFSFGFNTLLEGLDKKLKFLLLAEDYPSLNYPVISRGFDYDILAITADLEAQIYTYIEQESPDVLVLSIVNYIHGFKIDLSFIQQLKSDFPALLIIGDATQFLGTEPFDFDNSGFDAVGGSGYKWMMAGFGNGYMMLSEYMTSILYRSAYVQEKPKEAMWSHKSMLDIYFEPGHQDTLSQGTLGESVKFFQECGLENVQAYLKELTAYAYAVFQPRNWLLPFIAERNIKSSLINLQVTPDLYPYLLDQGIKCFPRGTGIRIGLHLYNSKEDVNRIVEIIEQKENEFENR